MDEGRKVQRIEFQPSPNMTEQQWRSLKPWEFGVIPNPRFFVINGLEISRPARESNPRKNEPFTARIVTLQKGQKIRGIN
jgi:hypothetical protein